MRQRFNTLEERVKALHGDGDGSKGSKGRLKRLSSYRVEEDIHFATRVERIEDELSGMHAKLEELLSLAKRTSV